KRELQSTKESCTSFTKTDSPQEIYIDSRQARLLAGVSAVTLRRWHKQNQVRVVRRSTGKRTYNQSDIYHNIGRDITPTQKRKICYSRVSSKGQVDDLVRQSEYLRFHYPVYELVSDVGSGINWYRKGFKAILESVLQGNVSEIVVTDIDRLARFSTDLLRQLFKLCGCKLVVHNEKDRTNIGFEEQMVFDVLHILHVYTCKINGKRKRKIKCHS